MGAAFFGLARVDLQIPGAQSLKDKRGPLRRAQAALRNDLGCTVAEVDFQNSWQRSALGVGVAASTESGVHRALDRVTAIIERDPRVVVLRTAVEITALDADGG